MSKLLHAIAIAIVLSQTVAVAQATETQFALVERTFEALKQSATALDQGDFSKAQALLASMESAAKTLHSTAERYSKEASAAADRREAEARAVTTQITENFNNEQAATKAMGEIEAAIADKTVRIEKAAKEHTDLQQQIGRLEERMKGPGFWRAHGRWPPSIDRYYRDLEDNKKQRSALESELSTLRVELNAHQTNLSEVRRHKAQLQAHRGELEQQDRNLRAAVISLSDASLFWTDTATLIDSRARSSIEDLKVNVRLRLKRADHLAPAPVFSSYDQIETRTLAETLKEFAKTLDNGTNIVLKP